MELRPGYYCARLQLGDRGKSALAELDQGNKVVAGWWSMCAWLKDQYETASQTPSRWRTNQRSLMGHSTRGWRQ